MPAPFAHVGGSGRDAVDSRTLCGAAPWAGRAVSTDGVSVLGPVGCAPGLGISLGNGLPERRHGDHRRSAGADRRAARGSPRAPHRHVPIGTAGPEGGPARGQSSARSPLSGATILGLAARFGAGPSLPVPLRGRSPGIPIEHTALHRLPRRGGFPYPDPCVDRRPGGRAPTGRPGRMATLREGVTRGPSSSAAALETPSGPGQYPKKRAAPCTSSPKLSPTDCSIHAPISTSPRTTTASRRTPPR